MRSSTRSADLGPIVLVGMMGSGKTTVSRLVGAALGRDVFDSDEMIERRTGHTVAEIWGTDGEPAFRRLETEVLDEALAADPPGVVAAAGGVVLADANRVRLQRVSERGGIVVWLRADPVLLASRVHAGDHRPLVRDDPTRTLARLAVERAPLYAEVADRTLDVDASTVEETVAAVLAEVTAVAGERSARR